MNPFDLKSALLAKHAQHVVLVHFPIALFIIGVLFDLLALWRQSRSLATAAYYNLTVAALSALPTVATGIIAWQWQFAGERLHGNLRLHLLLGSSSAVMIWLVWWVHRRARGKIDPGSPAVRLALEVVAVSVVALTGHVGGFLSGVNGPN